MASRSSTHWRVVAPIETPSRSWRTKARSGMRAMSISRFGRASRMAMSGTRVCPPAMMRASSPAASIAQAWSRSAGLAYSNDAGFIERRGPFFSGRGSHEHVLVGAVHTNTIGGFWSMPRFPLRMILPKRDILTHVGTSLDRNRGDSFDKGVSLIGWWKRLAGPDQEDSAYHLYRTAPLPA